ncbi:hypothetical protein [Halorussus pelagicus]|uniref:hypothetical protein n=1 Tax=Halorussus pelagicus TaxID=2505977 RepID=UPI000FFCA1F1|nr:hypothetical protein [Halorussus pelagicus]
MTQDETAYYLAVRSHVWEEFADRMDLTDDELTRLKTLHAEQFAASVGETTSDDKAASDRGASEEGTDETAMILTKE